jgi:hypothetical protein
MKTAPTGLGAISAKPTSGESEGRTATKAFRKRGFSFSLTTKPQAQQPERDVSSVGMFQFRNRSTAR